MSFVYARTVRFSDTDAAGVVYFANVLSMCHEAYEASLAEVGINLKAFFTQPAIAIPIVHAEVDFFRPMFCGDALQIHVHPQALAETEFAINYQLFVAGGDRALSQASTKHVCIDPLQRIRQPLPEQVQQWLKRWSDDTSSR